MNSYISVVAGLSLLLLAACGRDEPGPEAIVIATDEGSLDVSGDAGAPDFGRDTDSADLGQDAGPSWMPIDEFVATAVGDRPLPGVAAVVFDTDGPIVAGVTGVRKMGDPTLATLDDHWHLGSCTKAMTAMVAARLVERGDVAWTTRLLDVLDVADADPAFAEVTLIELLSHTAGMPGNLGQQEPALYQYMWSNPDNPRDVRAYVAEELLKKAPAQPVGTFTYANASFMVAGAMLEAASDTSWEQLMQTELFEPLEMDGCGFGPQATADSVDQPWPHRLVNGEVELVPTTEPWDNPPSSGPAGTVHCPILSWAKFGQLMVGDGGDYIATENMDVLRTVHAPSADAGLGWLVLDRPWANGNVLHHTGSNTLNFAVTWIAPELGKGVMVTTNIGGDEAYPHLDAIVAALVPEYFF